MPSEANVEVTMLYPIQYTKADEANYKVEIVGDYKMIKYTKRFYGGFGLSFNLFKLRTPLSSLVVFLTLWILLVLVLTIKRKQWQ